MELSPEERKRIYEEEKARAEAREQIRQEKRGRSTETSTGLEPNIAGLLCYVLGWISGFVMFVLEQKNSWVRFHAAQSIVVFGTLTVAGVVLGLIPFAGPAFSSIVGIIGFILWIVLMIKAYNGERFNLLWAGDIAERLITPMRMMVDYQEPPVSERKETDAAEIDSRIDRKLERYFKDRKAGRVTASAFAIAWSIVLLIFFNFFNEYFAYYQPQTVGNVVTWTRHPFFTSEISLWLPVLTLALAISIIGHAVLLIYDKYVIREPILIVIDAFSLAAVITLVAVYPFNFSVIPDANIATGVTIGVTIVLIAIAIGIGIGMLVRVIKFVLNVVRGITKYPEEA